VDSIERITLLVCHAALKAYISRGEVKTEGTYRRQAWRTTREFYNGEIDAFEFIDDFDSYIDNQFDRAYRQGARDVNVDPRTFNDDDLFRLELRKEQEREHILRLAEDIERARLNGEPIDQFKPRMDMWANRYNEVVNDARTHFGGRQLLEWVLGPTEHCTSCLAQGGKVRTAEEWETLRMQGIYPQSRSLECGGYHCQCTLQLTSAPPTVTQ
jgi:hypothetical protein